MKRRLLALFLGLILLVLDSTGVKAAVGGVHLDTVIEDVARYVQETVPDPQVAAVGGEWIVIGLARGKCEGGEAYCVRYQTNLEATLRQQNGVLHNRKHTEYARTILALTAMGKDARDVAGYDLTLPLADFEKTLQQGINGPIWALIALDSAHYPMPKDPQVAIQATRQMYLDEILSRQLADGGWSLTGTGDAEPDVTGMALQALACYQDQTAVAQAVDRALMCMSNLQDEQGGYMAQGEVNTESCVQMVVALAALGIDQTDPRFVKNGRCIMDALMRCYTPTQGFSHTADGARTNQMATEQGLYALISVRRFEKGQTSFYDMSDVLDLQTTGQSVIMQTVQVVGAFLCCLMAVTMA